MKRYKVGIVGCGYVGLVTGACLAEIGHTVTCIDNDRAKFEALQNGKIPIYEPGLERLVKKNVAAKRLSFGQWVTESLPDVQVIFIAVGTPPNADGSADLTHIQSVARGIAENMKRYTVVVEKSTVPVETGEDVERTIQANKSSQAAFDMVSNPEFLREGTAIHDFLHPDRIVLGVKSKRAEKIMRELYAPLKCKNILVTDLKSAELIKHASNSFLATKISFMNAVSRVCEQVGADAPHVAEGMGLDPRIGPAFLKPGIGFGGFCLPKDLEAFHYISKKVGYEFDLLRTVKEVNEDQRRHFIQKIQHALGGLTGKTIGVWGIAFKPHTDDIRFAASMDIIPKLQSLGARIQAFDPAAMEKARTVLKNVEFSKDPYAAARGADCLAILTEWPEFQRANFKRVKQDMAHPLIIDGRNALDAAKIRRMGFTYHGMGTALMRVLITGGAGFVGSHLCEYFLGKGHTVIAMDNLLTGSLQNIRHLFTSRRFSYVRHNVSSYIDVAGPLHAVLHFASPASPTDYHAHSIPTLKVGSLGTHNALGVAKKKRATFLLASTSEVYGDPKVSPQPETYWGNVNPVGPRAVYDEAKRFAEAMTMAYHHSHRMPVRIVRIFNTYGPRMRINDGRAIPNFIKQAVRNKPLVIYGDGRQTRSFCFIDDLVDGIYRLLKSSYIGPVNIGNPGGHMTIGRLAREIVKLTGSTSKIIHKPLPTDDPTNRLPDIRLARRVLRWSPKTPFSTGLMKTVDYVREIDA